MLIFISAVAVLLALGALGHRTAQRTGFTVLEVLSPAGRRLYRVLACLSMLLSAALMFALLWAYHVSPEPGDFYITTSWEGHGIFIFILWLCVSGMVCFVATNLIMGGYVESGPSSKRGYTIQQEASLAAARWAASAAKGHPIVPLFGFVFIGLMCLIGTCLMQGRHVRPTERGLAHLGFFDIYEDVLPWSDIAKLSVVRDADPDVWVYARWNLVWTDTKGNEAIALMDKNIWWMGPHTIN